MILADTSVWVDHLRRGNAELSTLLNDGLVLCHDFVIGELACGSIGNRSEVLHLLETLPRVEVATHAEVLALVEENRLWGRGLGWIDVHLLAASGLANVELWTLDKRLGAIAEGA